MERLRLSTKTLALIAVAMLVAAGTYAVASIPDSGGVITGCWYNVQDGSKPYGTLRLIDPSRQQTAGTTSDTYSCLTDETKITWNQQGPTGPAGPQGPAGAQGLQGLQGARAPSSFLSFTGGVKNGILLSLPGIAGDSTVKGHKGDIGLQDFSFGGATSTAAHGKTGEIIVVKRIDNSSPKLFRAAATGEHFKNAKITLRKAGRGQQDFLVFEMKDVLISGVKSTNAEGQPTEQVTINFTKVKVEYLASHPSSIQLTPHQFSLP